MTGRGFLRADIPRCTHEEGRRSHALVRARTSSNALLKKAPRGDDEGVSAGHERGKGEFARDCV